MAESCFVPVEIYREPPEETTGESDCPLRGIPFEDATVSKWLI
jgi:hypothetical protein